RSPQASPVVSSREKSPRESDSESVSESVSREHMEDSSLDDVTETRSVSEENPLDVQRPQQNLRSKREDSAVGMSTSTESPKSPEESWEQYEVIKPTSVSRTRKEPAVEDVMGEVGLIEPRVNNMLDDVADTPRWKSARGITNNSARENELGSGKWGAEPSTLDPEELRKRMPTDMPVRPMEIEEKGNGWAGFLVFFVFLVLILMMVISL
ncbi:MAG: hypothetical protein VX278_15325, partial [Myxococcota bacterium]|nr:hypothetical protein [Myxococcota bacterium]